MTLKETYLRNAANVKKENPDAEIVVVMRSKGHILSPSRALLNGYLAKKVNVDEYTRRFIEEMNVKQCVDEMRRIGELSKTKDVYLVCWERVGFCHRFLLIDMIKKLVPGA